MLLDEGFVDKSMLWDETTEDESDEEMIEELDFEKPQPLSLAGMSNDDSDGDTVNNANGNEEDDDEDDDEDDEEFVDEEDE